MVSSLIGMGEIIPPHPLSPLAIYPVPVPAADIPNSPSPRIGRRFVSALAVLGMTLSASWIMLIMYHIDFFHNPRLIWTAHMWLVVGGGKNVLIAMCYSMIADVEPAEKL